jgi:hypothetical protein
MQDGHFTGTFNALNRPTAIWSLVFQGTSNWMFFGFDPLGRCVKRWKGASAIPTPPPPMLPPFCTFVSQAKTSTRRAMRLRRNYLPASMRICGKGLCSL